MHKGVILLVKAEDREDAIGQAESFLECYGDGHVWDWYSIGGRWTGTLTGYDPEKDERNVEPCTQCDGSGFRNDLVAAKARVNDPSYTCKGCGRYDRETSKWTHGSFGPGKSLKWPTRWVEVDDDAVPLADCIEVVREWCKDPTVAAQEYLDKMNEEIEKEKADPNSYKMSGYYARQYGDAVGGYFCFDSNVYDVEYGTGEYIPDDLEGYWAVMVDMHN